jgi:hypothetical protein
MPGHLDSVEIAIPTATPVTQHASADATPSESSNFPTPSNQPQGLGNLEIQRVLQRITEFEPLQLIQESNESSIFEQLFHRKSTSSSPEDKHEMDLRTYLYPQVLTSKGGRMAHRYDICIPGSPEDIQTR